MKRFFLGTIFATTALLATVNAQTHPTLRSYNQQDRIAQGIRSGQLTAGETGRLEFREARINGQIARDRAFDGGHLTGYERARIACEQNRTSAAIYRDKHNGWVR